MSSRKRAREEHKSSSSSSSSSRRFKSTRRLFFRNVVPRFLARTGEVKSVDISLGTLTIASASQNAVPLYDSASGADLYQRIGRKVNLKSVRVRGYFVPANTGGSVAAENIRVILYTDNQFTSGSTGATTDLLQDLDDGGATHLNPLSGVNLNNRDRFKILRDMYTQMPFIAQADSVIEIGTQGGTVKEIITVDWFVNLRGFEISHSGNAAGDITKGNVCLQAIGGVGNWTFTFTSRVRFTDV